MRLCPGPKVRQREVVGLKRAPAPGPGRFHFGVWPMRDASRGCFPGITLRTGIEVRLPVNVTAIPKDKTHEPLPRETTSISRENHTACAASASIAPLIQKCYNRKGTKGFIRTQP